MKCSFTGHRRLFVTAELKNRLTKTLEALIAEGCTDFYAGGALGWDTLCERTVLSLRERYPWIRLHLLLPCSYEAQTSRWSVMQKAEYWALLNQADSVTYISPTYDKACMRRRNAALVEQADCLLCYYNAENRASGTGQTVRMAEKRGLRIVNLAEAK